MNLDQKRIIMDLPIKSYFCILSAYKNKSKTQIQYLCIPLSVGTATLFRHCSLRGPLMSTPLPFEWLMNEGTIDLLVAPTFHGLPRVWFDLASLRHQFWELKWFKKGGVVPLWSSWRYRDSDLAKLTIPHFGVPTGKDTGTFWQWHKRDLPKGFLF